MHEPRVFKRIINLFTICLFALAIKPAMADVSLPPPSAQVQTVATAPHGSGINFQNGSLHLKNGRPFNAEMYERLNRASTYPTATKSHPATFKDAYGNVSTGRINTASTIRPSALDGAVKGYLAADLAGKVLNSNSAHGAARDFATGNYAEGALKAAAAFDVFGIGSGLNSLKDTFQQAQAAKAASVAQQAQDSASQYDPTQHELNVLYIRDENTGAETVVYQGYRKVTCCWYDQAGNSVAYYTTGYQLQEVAVVFPFRESGQDLLSRVVPNDPNLFKPQITPEQLMLTQAEIQNILLQQLADQNSALNQNTEALKDLINYLIANGGLNPADLPTTVTGSETDRTFVSDAYTPAGQDVAQQTKFVVNPDGTVTVSTVPRPDLHPNSSQAPTRQPIGTPTKRPRPDFDDDDDVDICDANPNILACIEPGSADYEDIVLPKEERKLEFKTDDVFASYGTCPAPTSVQVINSRIELSYQPMCDMAARLRSLVIFLGVAASMFMVWRTLNG